MIVIFDLSQDEADRIDVVFPGGGVITNRQDALDGLATHAGGYLSDVLEWRSYAAITGAMRWPWSQEARIESRTQFRYL